MGRVLEGERRAAEFRVAEQAAHAQVQAELAKATSGVIR